MPKVHGLPDEPGGVARPGRFRVLVSQAPPPGRLPRRHPELAADGFHPAAQLVSDARRHGVEVRPVDVNHSRWNCTLESSGGCLCPVRLGLCFVAGLAEKDAARLVGARSTSHHSIDDLQRRARLGVGTLSRLAEADAFRSLALTRRGAAWAIKALHDAPLPLFEAADAREGGIAPEMPEAPMRLNPPPAGREVVDDYAALGFSLRAHLVLFLRGALTKRGAVQLADLAGVRDGAQVRVAGLVLVRQRSGSAKGVMFLTLENESGPSNIIVWPSLIDRHRRVLFAAGMMGVEERLQREGRVENAIANRLVDLSPALTRVGERGWAGGTGAQANRDERASRAR